MAEADPASSRPLPKRYWLGAAIHGIRPTRLLYLSITRRRSPLAIRSASVSASETTVKLRRAQHDSDPQRMKVISSLRPTPVCLGRAWHRGLPSGSSVRRSRASTAAWISGEILFASGIALRNRLARIAGSFPVFGSLCERDVRPLESDSLIGSADGWIAQVPAGVSGKRNGDLRQAHAVPLVAIRIHLRHQNGKRGASFSAAAK